MHIQKIHSDSYLKEFVSFCKERYNKNLIGLGIYGSYAWGYFDKKKSDYDVFLVFNQETKNESNLITNKLEKISVQYFGTAKQLSELISEGHWSLYITLLKSAKMLYFSSEYKQFFNGLNNTNFVKNLKNTDRIKFKAEFDRDQIQKMEGYPAIKYAFPALRSRLQLLTYAKYQKPIWDLDKAIKLNKDFLTNKEQSLLVQLNNSVKERKNDYFDKNLAIDMLDKINRETLSLLDKNKN